MNRTDRLVAMVMYLQGRRVVRAEELAEHFEVNVRTVYRDVAALGEAGVPISGEAGVGYSLVKGYHLPPVMLTTDEAMALFLGGEMVTQFADGSLKTPVSTALLKIRSVLPPQHQEDVRRLAETTSIYGASKGAHAPDQRVLLPVQQAIVSRRVLRLEYCGAGKDQPSTRFVEPLGVSFHSGSWYLVAWCRLRGAFRHFKLERVLGFELTTERFAPRPDFDLRKHLEAEIGGSSTCVRLWFSDKVARRARRESYRGFESEVQRDGGLEVEMMTYSVEWIAQWILSFGSEAQAIAPEHLRQRVVELLQASLAAYDESFATKDF